ncbi:MAG: glycosyltransferase family 4 protein [Candidatus Methanogasteraceae archaeon]
MAKITTCIVTQTPLIRFKLDYSELLDKYGTLPDPVPFNCLEVGEDYDFAPGGVPKMVYPLQRLLVEGGHVDTAHWVSLNMMGPERVLVDNILVHNIMLEHKYIAPYARFKERIWAEIHNIDRKPIGAGEFSAYARYNWLCADKMFELLPVDIFYIHDFQQLLVGNMIGLAAPTVFRWHIPFDLENTSSYVRRFIVRCIESFDGVVVSCKRDLEGLIRAGYQGRAYQTYPYIDQRRWTEPTESESREFCSRSGVADDDIVLLMVARMDEIKGQDIAIRALAKVPHAKLVLIGNGSFTSSERGGLAHPKGSAWNRYLKKLAGEMGVSGRVIFTGYMADNLLKAAYRRCDAMLFPSRTEGFGLVVVEAWMYEKPVIVSDGAGVSELTVDGLNGYTFESGNADELAEKINTLLASPDDAREMGKRGYETARQCYIEEGVRLICDIFSDVITGFKH